MLKRLRNSPCCNALLAHRHLEKGFISLHFAGQKRNLNIQDQLTCLCLSQCILYRSNFRQEKSIKNSYHIPFRTTHTWNASLGYLKLQFIYIFFFLLLSIIMLDSLIRYPECVCVCPLGLPSVHTIHPSVYGSLLPALLSMLCSLCMIFVLPILLERLIYFTLGFVTFFHYSIIVWSTPHDLHMPMWVSYGFSGFLLHTKTMQQTVNWLGIWPGDGLVSHIGCNPTFPMVQRLDQDTI